MRILAMAVVLVVCEGAVLPMPHNTEQLLNQDLHSDIEIQPPNHKIFHSMIDHNHELTAVESYLVESSHMIPTSVYVGEAEGGRATGLSPFLPIAVLQEPALFLLTTQSSDIGRIGERQKLGSITNSLEIISPTDVTNTQRPENNRSTTSDHKKTTHSILQQKPHKRQKRSTFGKKLRAFVLPLSIFNYLGFLPVRVPGLPYHSELPSPDYSYYDTVYEIKTPYRKKRQFYFF